MDLLNYSQQIVAAAGGAMGFVAAACMEWVSVKGQKFMGGGEV